MNKVVGILEDLLIVLNIAGGGRRSTGPLGIAQQVVNAGRRGFQMAQQADHATSVPGKALQRCGFTAAQGKSLIGQAEDIAMPHKSAERFG